MAVRKPYGISGSGATAEDYRRGILGNYVRNSDGTLRQGVLGPGGNIVTSRTNLAVDVGQFQAVVAHGTLGALPLQNDGTVVVTLTVAPTSNSRIDVIYVKANDTLNGDANNTPIIERATGQASATPQKPLIPIGALELATVVVPAGATTTQSSGVVITNSYWMTAMAGGVVNLRSATEQASFPAQGGQVVHRTDLGIHRVLIGSTWQTVQSSPLPTVVMAASGSLPQAQHTITDGIVEISGNGLKGPGFENIFTLPAGRRPARVLRFPDYATQQTIVINPSGRVDYTDNSTNITVTFDGIRFRAA